MEQIMFTVRFEIFTSKYNGVSTDLEIPVIALSYDDAAGIVTTMYHKYEGFKLGEIKPIGIPQLKLEYKGAPVIQIS